MLRQAGGEYGAATGRLRRVGPFDAVASRYGLSCQQADRIALTKLDVLSGLKTVSVIDAYHISGEIVRDFPADARLERAEPVITELPGWQCDISGCRSWQELPENARHYVEALETMIGQFVDLVSVGAARDACFPTRKGSWLLT